MLLVIVKEGLRITDVSYVGVYAPCMYIYLHVKGWIVNIFSGKVYTTCRESTILYNLTKSIEKYIIHKLRKIVYN